MGSEKNGSSDESQDLHEAPALKLTPQHVGDNQNASINDKAGLSSIQKGTRRVKSLLELMGICFLFLNLAVVEIAMLRHSVESQLMPPASKKVKSTLDEATINPSPRELLWKLAPSATQNGTEQNSKVILVIIDDQGKVFQFQLNKLPVAPIHTFPDDFVIKPSPRPQITKL